MSTKDTSPSAPTEPTPPGLDLRTAVVLIGGFAAGTAAFHNEAWAVGVGTATTVLLALNTLVRR